MHEELLQDHTLQIGQLETEVGFKKEKIDAINMKIDKLEEKLDQQDEKLDKILNKSIESDNDIDKRVTSLETTVKIIKYVLSLVFGTGLIWYLIH